MVEPALRQVYQFGRHVIPRGQIFLQTRLSYAFTNRKPVLPGHVLVSTRRVVKRFADLTPAEVSDLFLCVHRVAPVVERAFQGTSTTIAMQDGLDAGQTVEHVHVHIIPRKPGDFENNDDIYVHLEKHDTTLEDKGPFRTPDEMASEAVFIAQQLPTGDTLN